MTEPRPSFDPLAPDRPPEPRATHPAALPEPALLRDCTITRGRSGGPGGQHRNKTETHIIITHTPTGLIGQAGERRSAEVNRKVALRRLRLELATRHRLGVSPGEARTELWIRRCRGGRIACNPAHADFPAMLALALDVLEACRLDHKRAAIRLGCTPSQLVRFLKDHPPAWGLVNEQRGGRGMPALK